ncbi:MAG TPA: hypothetical protein DCP57_01915 [Gammaproteobacteria bacterium]|nr:hypothetical protein [Gammaproteobacteria bacterium]
MPKLNEVQAKIAAGELDQALRDLETLLAENPWEVEALYALAVVLRYQGRYEDALDVLERLRLLAPSHSRAFQETGHVHRDVGAWQDALVAYERALQLNPALLASLRESLKICDAQGDSRRAIHLRARLEHLEALPAPLISVIELISQNKLIKAEEICRAFLQKAPRNVEGMRLLAEIGVKLGILDDAEFLLDSATQFAPEHVPAHIDLVQVLRKRQKFEAALAQAKRLFDRQPQNPQFKSIYAIELMQTGKIEAALTLLDEVLAQVPGDAATLTTKGHALKTKGESLAAIDAYRSAYEHNPDHGEAFYSLANLKTYRFTDEELQLMGQQENNRNLSPSGRVYLNFALGKAHEDAADYERAFGYYAEGNRQKKIQSRYDAEKMRVEFQDTQRVCTASLLAEENQGGNASSAPIFVLGLPRAGSTLIEQILSSHSMVDGTSELPNILSLSQSLRRKSRGSGGYPAVLADLTMEERTRFGDQYIADTQIHRGDAAFFVDKMPNNFRHIGLIKLILPNAKIIDARRHPLSCCFSGFKQLFAEGQEFSYDLGDIGHYYRDYVELMDHWDRVMPGFILRVQHEDVVDDLRGQVARLLAFCGLPFEEACVAFHKTERSVKTPSSEQVRQPIFRSSLDTWENYEPWLSPLKQALGEEVRQRFDIKL